MYFTLEISRVSRAAPEGGEGPDPHADRPGAPRPHRDQQVWCEAAPARRVETDALLLGIFLSRLNRDGHNPNPCPEPATLGIAYIGIKKVEGPATPVWHLRCQETAWGHQGPEKEQKKMKVTAPAVCP